MANQEVESRIVEMQFDGKDFDKNIRKSQKNLEDFKKSLDFEEAARQMQAVTQESGPMGKSIDSIAKNVKKLTKEFAGVGSIGIYIAKKLKKAWEGALNSVERFTKSLTTEQFKEGKTKYEGLLKSVQTIMNATNESEEYVYQVMSKLNKYTDETSYNFADMAQNIGKFTTAGVKLEDAEAEMEGIANWAALAGQGTAEAQRAMYNISQAMSAGSMQLRDYRSIQNANMDIREFRQQALDAAVAAGTLKKGVDGVYKTVKGGKTVNIDNFTETLSYKWFDRKTMETVFKTFGDTTTEIGLKAYKAAQRCTTLTDVIKAWKDMLSTGWMKSYEHVFGKLSDAMGLFSGLCNKVSEDLAKLVEIRNKILERWNLGGGRNALWGALFGELETPDGETLFKDAYGLLDAMRDIGDAIREAFWDFVGQFISPENKALFDQDKEGRGMQYLAAMLTDLTTKFQNFTKKIKDFLFTAEPGETESRMDRIKTIVKAILSVILLIVKVVGGIGQFIGEIGKQLYPAFHAIELLIDYLLQLFTGTVASAAKKNTIGNFFHTLAVILKPVTTVINVVVQVLAALIAQIIEAARKSGVIQLISDSFKALSATLMKLIEKALKSGLIQKVFDWISRAIAKLPALVAKIRELGSTFLDTVKKSKALTAIKGFFGKMFQGKGLKEILKNLKSNLKNIIKKIPSIIPSLKDALGKVWEKLSGFFGNLFGSIFGISGAKAEGSEEATQQMAEAIVKPIENLGDGTAISEAVDKVKTGFLDKLKTKLKEIWDKISGFFTTLANSDGVKKIKEFFAGTNFKELLSGATQILKWLAIFRTGSGLVSIGKGVKSLGKGIKVFGKNLKNLNLSSMFKDMFNISNIINSNNTDNSKRVDFSKLGGQILMVAGAVLMVAFAAEKFSKMDEDQLKKAGISIAVVLGALVGAGYLAKKFASNGASLFALAAGVLLLLVPLQIVQKMNMALLLKGVAKLGLIVGALALAIAVAGNSKPGGFISMALALTLLLIPLKALMNMPLMTKPDWTGGLIQGIVALEALMVSMALAARIGGNNKAKGLISMALALTIMLIPIKTLANMKWYEALQGVGAIIVLLAGITAMIRITKDCDKTKLAGIVAAISVLALVGMIIGKNMSWDQALIGFVPIIAMLGFMALMMNQASKLNEEQMKALKGIFASFAAVIIVIAAAIVVLSQMNTGLGLAITFMAGIVLILGVMGYMMKQASRNDPKKMTRLMGVLFLLGVIIAVAGGALILMSKENVDWKMVLAFLGGITALVAVVGVLLIFLSKVDPAGAIVGILALAGAIAAIMAVVSLLLPVVMESFGNGMSRLAAKLKSIGALLGSFFERLSAISEEELNHAVKVFDTLKDMMLQFTGFAMFEGNMRAVMSSLNYLSAGLTAFFVNEGKYPDPESSQTFKALQKIIDFSPSLVSFSVGDMPTQLLYLGVGMMLFDEATKNITSAEPPSLALLQGIFGQADNIEKFTKLPITSFASQMSSLGGAMSLYAKGAKEVTGLDVEGGEAPDITDSIAILKAVCMAISGEDGSAPFVIPRNMPDSTALGLFAGNLEALGTALSTFATAAHSMETDTTNAMALLKFLAEIAGYVTPGNLAVVDAFDDIGHVDANGEGGKLGQFALDIGALGTALSTFASSIGGNEAAFGSGLGVLDHFQELNSKLTASNLKFVRSFINAGIDKTALGVFSDDITALGGAIASFAANVMMEDGTQADFNYALSALDFLTSIQNRLPDLGGLYQLIHGQKETLDRLAGDMTLVGQALHDFSENVMGTKNGGTFDLDSVNDAFTVLLNLIKIINMLNITAGDTGSRGWVDVADKISDFADLLTALNSKEAAFFNGIDDGNSIIYGLAKFAQNISKAFIEMGDIDAQALSKFADIASGIAALTMLDPSYNFEYPGSMIAEGISIGIANGESKVIQATVKLVKAAIDAAKETAVIKSPSKVFAEIGQYMDLGMAKGLYGDQDKVEKAGGETAQTAIDQAATMMGLISQAMADSVDLQPTITPVLDMSQVTAAGSKLDSFFSGYALNLNEVLNRASMATSKSGPAEVVVSNPTDLSGVQQSMAMLQTEINNLQTAIGNIKIVLNTGVVAGGVTDDIDLNLGRKQLYASRRN